MPNHNDAIPSAPTGPLADPAAASQSRRPEDIEHEIESIRARMDSVIDEIEFRLSPGQMSGGVVQVVRDVIQGGGDGMSGRIARAVRANPIPVALIGIGALWLGWAVARTPEMTTEFDDYDAHGRRLDPRSRQLLSGLIAACRDGSAAFRRADMTIADPGLSPRLEDLADQLDRSAAALDEDLRNGGGWVETGEAGDGVGDGRRAWSPLHGLAETAAGRVVAGAGGPGARGDLLVRLESGLDDTLALFRDALADAPDEHLQVAIGAQFHAIETARHRVGALREAVA
ncbi:hypothetical protein VY88_18675 [Azospirillum thiophilum]|uniref:DUF3618 domain-containing protein n=1 Tax=Azospirillum thiophilum TaxID=528244 RepID=A0AAC8ZVK5_9PROT|nr:DUF3618 domain-containing protein [Azospirillum thiophilum]ALG74107.1 hypothetical protein AL072_24245 [Azospirillum thiophilum]KJR63553.1 hypothetical protein VY88_18675 [Azospirillum thiophilum]